MPPVTSSEWKTFLDKYPNAHLLQSAEWGELKANYDWKVYHVIFGNTGAQILLRRILPGINIAYIPKGPIGIKLNNSHHDNVIWKNLITDIDKICQRENAFLLKIEPDILDKDEKIIDKTIKTSQNTGIGTPDGFRLSNHSIQPQQTIVVDLSNNEDIILSRMKQKTRYNIRLARRKNIVIHPSADINLFFHMMEETSERDDFNAHNQTYYQTAYDLFHPCEKCELFIADYQNIPVAGLMIFTHGDRSWYLYGASSNLHRERMPTYLLQWEAMRWAKAHGCLEYDLWGIPDEDQETLERQFTQRSDGLWGVYRFKRGFGGELRRSAGPWDRVYNPLLYHLYNWWTRKKLYLQ